MRKKLKHLSELIDYQIQTKKNRSVGRTETPNKPEYEAQLDENIEKANSYLGML